MGFDTAYEALTAETAVTFTVGAEHSGGAQDLGTVNTIFGGILVVGGLAATLLTARVTSGLRISMVASTPSTITVSPTSRWTWVARSAMHRTVPR